MDETSREGRVDLGPAKYELGRKLSAIVTVSNNWEEAAEHFAAEFEPPSQAAADVLAERRRQVEVEGWTPEHDDEHTDGELADAAACYALAATGTPDTYATEHWPWDRKWWKPSDPRRDLVKACALILAEIERMDRLAATRPHTQERPADGND